VRNTGFCCANSSGNFAGHGHDTPHRGQATAIFVKASQLFQSGKEFTMPDRRTIERAREDAREGKAPSTQAGEFVREEIDHVREGKHGVRSPKQAIAIGLSKARKAGIKVPPAPRGSASEKKTKRAARKRSSETTRKRSQATTRALKREGRSGASHSALSRQAKSAARTRRSRASGKKRSSRKTA
jgi:hypothetical protein